MPLFSLKPASRRQLVPPTTVSPSKLACLRDLNCRALGPNRDHSKQAVCITVRARCKEELVSSAITGEAKDPPMRTIRIDANKLFFITSPSFPFLYTRLATYGGHIPLRVIVAYAPCLA